MVWESVNTRVGCIRKGKAGEVVALMCFENYTQVSKKLILRIVLGEIESSGQILTIAIVNNTGITNLGKTPTNTVARVWAAPIWDCTLLEENPH